MNKKLRLSLKFSKPIIVYETVNRLTYYVDIRMEHDES